MQHLSYLLSMLLTGLVAVTFIDTIGSIVSRWLNFTYGYFSILSFIVYVTIAYLIAEKTNRALSTVIVTMLIGFYDGTVGWIIAHKLKASFKYSKEIAEKITMAHSVFVANLFSILCGIIGYFLGTR